MGDIGDYWREHKEYVRNKKHENSVDDFEEGDRVTFMPWKAKGNPKHPACEKGVVVRKDFRNVYVRFGEGKEPEACDPTQLD